MATDFTVNAVTASLAPFSQRWRQIEIGRDHNKRAIYAANWEIDLSFESGSITYARQWIEAASAGASANVTVLTRTGLGWTDLSAIQLEIVEYPATESGLAGAFSMVIRGAT